MPRFRFKLEALRRQRQAVEEQCKRELAAVLRQRVEAQTRLVQMQQQISDSKQSLGQGLVGKVDLDGVAQFARYAGQAAHRARQIVVDLAGIEQRVESARNKLLQATRARKAMDLLHDKQLAAWKKQMARREAGELDELTTQRFAHTPGGGEAGV